jgi:thiol-disulfide isomerase/thioredoxin
LLAQTEQRPVVGERCPDFVIRNIMDDPDSLLTFEDLTGRFIILDFWSKYCSTCMGTLPGTDSVYRDYNDRITFLLIGTEDKEQRMRPMFYDFRQRMDLIIPFAFDSALFRRFVPNVVPHLIWIDNQGIVRAITTSEELKPGNVDAFLQGKPFEFRDWSFASVAKRNRLIDDFDFRTPFMINGNGGHSNEYIMRSILVPYKPDSMALIGLPVSIDRFVTHYPKGNALQGCVTLEQLYKFAYTGYPTWFYRDPPYREFFPKCILEVKDSSLFTVDVRPFRGFYWYSLLITQVPKTKEQLLKWMQEDLSRSFGYKVHIRYRRMPCWIVKSTRTARKNLRSKGGDGQDDHLEPAEIKLTNVPIEQAIGSIFYRHVEGQPPILDKTRMNHNVDILLTANNYDFDEICTSLARQGLIVKRSRAMMRTIVISDY